MLDRLCFGGGNHQGRPVDVVIVQYCRVRSRALELVPEDGCQCRTRKYVVFLLVVARFESVDEQNPFYWYEYIYFSRLCALVHPGTKVKHFDVLG